MGRRFRTHTVDAYLLEPNHIAKTRELIAACEAPGAGTLVHPWLGEFRVVCVDCRQNFSRDRGAVGQLTIEFVEAGLVRYPEISGNDVGSIDNAGLTADEVLLRDMSERLSVESMPDYVTDDSVGLLESFAGQARAVLEPVLIGAQTAARWTRSAFAIAREAQAMVRNPLFMGERILGLLDIGNIGGLSGVVNYSLELAGEVQILIDDPGQSPLWQQYASLANWTPVLPSIPKYDTRSRRQQAQNRDTLVSFVRRSATIEAARAAVRQDFETYEDAVTARDFLVDRLETEAETAPDEVFRELMAVRTAVVKAISAKAPLLPRLLPYTPNTTMPAMVIANALYGHDADSIIDRSEEIVNRNRVRNPLFVPGGEVIMVLSTEQG